MSPRSRSTPAATVGGLRTRLLTAEGTGPTVLLVHGFSDSADSWLQVMDQLSAAGHRAVAIDLPHHGRAERPTAEGFFGVVDDFVAAAVNHVDDGAGVLLVGNSVGGLAALHDAQRADLPLIGVLAIGPAGIRTPAWMRLIDRTRAITTPLVGATSISLIRGTAIGPTLIAAGFARAVARGKLTPASRARYASHWGPGDLHRQLTLGGHTIAELTAPDVLPAAPFTVPVTMAWGAHDWICPPPRPETLQQTHPGVDVRIWSDTGHCPQYDRPELVTALITDILATAPALPVTQTR